MKSTRKRMTRLMAFGPAIVLVCVTAYVASGASVVSSATAVSSVGVQGTVATGGTTDPDVSDASCTGAGSETDIAGGGEMLAGTWNTTLQTTSGCLVSFWTNNATGASVNYVNAFATTEFFCMDPTPGDAAGRDCSTDNRRVENVAPGTAIANGDDEFGIALTVLGGGGGVSAGTGATAAPVANPGTGDAVWYPITNAAQQLCDTNTSNTSGTTAQCTFRLGGSGEATQAAGSYYGQATLTITQNP